MRIWMTATALAIASATLFGGSAAAQDDGGEEYSDPARFAPAPYIPDGERNQNPQEGKLKGTTLRLKRALLMVTDLARSIQFYENVIGLEVYSVEQVYSVDQTTIGNFIFNTPPGTRRRVALFNTSNEARGLALREIDAPFEVPQRPRLTTILFEASDIMGIRERALAVGAEIVGPNSAVLQSGDEAPPLRYLEMGVIDPDGHIVTFFRYYQDTPEDQAAWEAALARIASDTEK